MKHKGCIMEVREDTMVVMAEDCNFYEIKKRDFIHEGMEIEFHLKERVQHKKYKRPSFAVAAAAIVLLFITSIYGINNWLTYNQPIALLTIDINPSVQLEINNQNEIIRAVALNKEAEELQLSSLKKKNIREALDTLLQKAEEKGYLIDEEKNYILLTTVTLDETKMSAEQFMSMLQEVQQEVEINVAKQEKAVEIVSLEASREALERAQKDNVSVGKLTIYEEIKESNDSIIDFTELKKVKIRELISLQNKHQAEREHPIFEEHPSKKNKPKESEILEKEHPVFDQHPGQRNKNNQNEDKESTKSESRDNHEKTVKEKQHPVFDQHPGSRNNKEEKQHPVFEEHPGQGRQKKD